MKDLWEEFRLPLFALLFVLVSVLIGFTLVHAAETQHQGEVTDHFWIQRNGKYTERWNHQTHCCSKEHCMPANEIGVIVRPTPTGDWEVLGGPLGKPEIVSAEDVYQTEKEGGQQIWVCIWKWKAVGEQVACLFIPPPET